MDKSYNIIRNLALSALFTFFFFIVTQKVYRLPFSYGDDHPILAMLHPEKVSNAYKVAFYGHETDLKGIILSDIHIGRFRPLSRSYNKLLCVICSDNTHLFRLSNLVILFLSGFFLLCIFTCFEIDWLSALIVLTVYVFGRNNETWWTLIPPPQNIGEMFLLAGIYVWLRYRKKSITGFYVLPALFFFLACISKESFIFCIPVLLITDYFFFNPAKRFFTKEYLFPVIAALLPFLALLITMLYVKKVFSYPYKESLWSIAIYNLFQFMRGVIFLLAPVLSFFLSKQFRQKKKFTKILFIIGVKIRKFN